MPCGRYVGIGIVILCALVSAGVYVAFLPLFFHTFYIGEAARPWDRAFGWGSGFAFILLIPPIMMSAFASQALMFLLLSLGTMQLEASFDKVLDLT
jgi:hypothetical protein